jgi:hypothetical protein
MWYNDLPFPLRIASNPWRLIIAFVIFLIVFDLVLVRLLRLNKIAWKRIDYIWLIIAALGLLSTATESRRLLAVNEIEVVKFRAASEYKFLQSEIRSAKNWICSPFHRTEYSPPDYDEIVQEFSKACDYYDSLLVNLSSEPPTNFGRFDLPKNIQRPNVKNDSLRDSFIRLDSYIERYNQFSTEHANLIKLNDKTEFERGLTLLGPLLLAFALALRITKVTGEIKLERQTK